MNKIYQRIRHILDFGIDIVLGARQEQNGDVKRNHENIARMWNAFLFHKLKDGQKITGSDAASLMGLLKVARTLSGRFNLDDYIDGATYHAISGALKEDEVEIKFNEQGNLESK
tara:strand:+ start:237 stop:578 length:342 start_codon:yes stop_codon:yes gene_type:complete